jgi:hypothetical protein
MQISSNWRLTYDPTGTPLVLLDFGQIMEGEFTIPWRQQAESRGKIRATTSTRYARGNVESGLALTTFKDHATDAAARLWLLQTSIALNGYSGRTALLRLEISGSETVYQLADATLDAAESELRIAGNARTRTRWQIGGTGWSVAP